MRDQDRCWWRTTTPEDAMLLDAKDAAIREAIDKAIAKVKVKDKRVKVRCWRLRNREGLFVREIAKITRAACSKGIWFCNGNQQQAARLVRL